MFIKQIEIVKRTITYPVNIADVTSYKVTYTRLV